MDNINFNKDKGTYSFYSLKENPWHGLGTVVDNAETPEEILKIANLDYEVALAPLYASFVPKNCVGVYKYGDGCFDCKVPSDNGLNSIIIPKKGELITTNYATYRTDNYDIFGVVGNRYEPVQNSVAMDFIYNILNNQDIINKNDIIIETAGVLGKGERIFVTAKLPNYDIAGDEINPYILFTTTHDGSGSIVACFTSIRVVCNNTLNMALNNSTNKIYFKHTKNVLNKLEEGSKLMGLAINYSGELKESLEPLSKTNIKEKEAIDFIQDLFLTESQVKYANEKGSIFNINNSDEVIATKTLNKIKEAVNYIENGVGQDSQHGTALWLYNGITSYINNGMNYKSKEDKFNSITDGIGYKLNQKAFNLITNRFYA